jgi:arginyl-tRNA synthetase
MPLAKRLQKSPRDIAEAIKKDLVEHGVSSLISNISLAGG